METRIVEQLHEQTLVGRVAWLIRLRWLAIAGLTATVLLVEMVFPIRLPGHAKGLILAIVLVIGFYNLLLHRRLKAVSALVASDPDRAFSLAQNLTRIQILADLVCLMVILDLSGGLINPLCLFMVFHVAIAGIILPRLEAFAVALLASLLLGIMGLMGFLFPGMRIPLAGFPLESVCPSLAHDGFFLVSVVLAYSGTFFLIAYFSTGVSHQLREAFDNLEHANASLRRQDELLARFLRTATHQLRSPLSAIISLINAHLQDNSARSLPPGFGDLFRRIEGRCRSLLELIDDLLRLTQVRENLDRQEEPVLTDINQVVTECAQAFESRAREKGLQLEVHVDSRPALLLARPRDLPDILENLLSNAIKYTDAGSVRVDGRIDQGRYILSVSDTGIGIPEKDQGSLFEEFFRAGNAHKKDPHSSGLGLNITQAVVRRLNGTIEFTSREGQGTTFKVVLPMARASQD